MKECISREAALAALKTYNKEPFHILHGLTVEGVMRWYANELGYGEDADFWATVGLLHDIDFEMWPEQHCRKAPELLKKHLPRHTTDRDHDGIAEALAAHGIC